MLILRKLILPGMVVSFALLTYSNAQTTGNSAKSLARGKIVYEETGACSVCHGIEGRGDGQAAASLLPKVPDFSKGFKAGDRFSDIYKVIENGSPGTSMAGYNNVLSADDLSSVTGYVIYLQKKLTSEKSEVTPFRKPSAEDMPESGSTENEDPIIEQPEEID